RMTKSWACRTNCQISQRDSCSVSRNSTTIAAAFRTRSSESLRASCRAPTAERAAKSSCISPVVGDAAAQLLDGLDCLVFGLVGPDTNGRPRRQGQEKRRFGHAPMRGLHQQLLLGCMALSAGNVPRPELFAVYARTASLSKKYSGDLRHRRVRVSPTTA